MEDDLKYESTNTNKFLLNLVEDEMRHINNIIQENKSKDNSSTQNNEQSKQEIIDALEKVKMGNQQKNVKQSGVFDYEKKFNLEYKGHKVTSYHALEAKKISESHISALEAMLEIDVQSSAD